jgi:hypothetical protein
MAFDDEKEIVCRAKRERKFKFTMSMFLLLLNQCLSSLHVFLYERVFKLRNALFQLPF